MKLIDKDAAVAEIKRRLSLISQNTNAYEEGRKRTYIAVLYLLDTLEIKEVDLEKEMSEYFVEHPDEFFSDKYKLFARHFFELGVKAAQKGG